MLGHKKNMGRSAYRLRQDVAGEKYDFLITTLLDHCEAFGLVRRDQLRFSETADAVRADLRPLQLKHRKTDRWPGTRIVGHQASVITYRANLAAGAVLRRPGSLFSWLAPAYPEDLWFVGKKSALQLASVAHEGKGWIFSRALARVIGQRITLELEPRSDGDEVYFELAV